MWNMDSGTYMKSVRAGGTEEEKQREMWAQLHWACWCAPHQKSEHSFVIFGFVIFLFFPFLAAFSTTATRCRAW
jgi:hypothetical protein